jgi:predicted enzyme related to lactoylglutathione lyase
LKVSFDEEGNLRLAETVEVPTTTVPGIVTFALFAEPEGNVVGLVKSEPQA